jgi:uncharacterized protein DUF6788
MSKRNGQAKRLVERRAALAAALPRFAEVVRGSLVTRYRRCGKPTCHCVTTRGHGPAHYLVVTLKPGKTEQILLSAEMLPVARQFLENYNRWWAALEQVSAVNRRLLRLRVAEVAGPAHSPRTKSD